MFDRIFADYLVKKNLLKEDDLRRIYSGQEKRYVRLGVIAISEKLMTIEQVEEINELQAIYDKRFGDIAISEGYLSPEQVNRLLVLQGNPFLAFMQAVIDLDLMSAEEFDKALEDFQKDNDLTLMNMEELKSCAIDRIIPLYLFDQPEPVQALVGVMIRTIVRLVDNHVYIKKPAVVKSAHYPALSLQDLKGDYRITTALSGDVEETMYKAAVAFAGSDNIVGREDGLDAMCELINCVNGLYASDVSNRDIDIDMVAPTSRNNEGDMKSDAILVVPMIVCGNEMDMFMVYDKDYVISD